MGVRAVDPAGGATPLVLRRNSAVHPSYIRMAPETAMTATMTPKATMSDRQQFRIADFAQSKHVGSCPDQIFCVPPLLVAASGQGTFHCARACLWLCVGVV